MLISKEIPLMKGSSLVKKSAYNKEFIERPSETSQLQKESDHLKFRGPSQKITSYGNQFVSKTGMNQYVKPTDSFSMGSFPLNAKTTYGKEFEAKRTKRHNSLKAMDTLKSGGMWIGKSAYNMKFKNPNPEDYPKINPLRSKS